jgi:GNAT superfamily N-acetyltransferase
VVNPSAKTFTIIPFRPEYQDAVEALVLHIQRDEFGFDVTREQQPDLMNITGMFQQGSGNFWVALDGEKVIGTIGIVDISNQQVALKKMFVAEEFRGKELGVGQSLLNTVFDWSRQHDIVQIFLGTTNRMHAAHRFYEKNGFVELQKEQLPQLFPIVFVDTKFYRREL